MDWTMIENAEDKVMRLQTLHYLLKERYRLNAVQAASQLQNELHNNALCLAVIHEAETELAQPTGDLGMGQLFTDTEVRQYLRDILDALDKAD